MQRIRDLDAFGGGAGSQRIATAAGQTDAVLGRHRGDEGLDAAGEGVGAGQRARIEGIDVPSPGELNVH